MYVLPHISYITDECTLGSQKLGTIWAGTPAIQQEWFAACDFSGRNWHLTYSIYVFIWLKEITLFVKYITFVILLYLRVPLKWLLLFHLRIGGRKGRNLAWALYPYHTFLTYLQELKQLCLIYYLQKKKKKNLKEIHSISF